MMNSEYNLQSCLRDTSKKNMELNHRDNKILYAHWMDSPLGKMLSIADETCLYLLEFAEQKNLERKIENLKLKTQSTIEKGVSQPIQSIKRELKAYFDGNLKQFETPLQVFGTPFQKSVWQVLLQIPYGKTRSYSEQATVIGKPSAFRAVANANGANRFAIVIPCHRIINTNGDLGGYAGGIHRKKWLIDHELNS